MNSLADKCESLKSSYNAILASPVPIQKSLAYLTELYLP